MEKTILGEDLEICRILNGMWQVAGGHGQIDSQLAIQDMEKYQKLGFTTWDLADIYGPAESLIGDFNSDSLPDLFMINHGLDTAPFDGEMCTLLLSDKITHKYKLGDLSMVPKGFWHGGASGDLNGDGIFDMVVNYGLMMKILWLQMVLCQSCF